MKPNEFAKEAPYIKRNINATRAAFGLDRVERDDFAFTQFSDVADANQVIDSNKGTIDNARLWDPEVIQATYAASRADPDLLQDRRRRRRPVPRRRRDPSGADRRPRAQRRRSPEPVVREPPRRLHARVRPGRVAEQRGAVGRRPRLLPERHPAVSNGIDLQRARRPRSTSARTSASYVLVDAKQREFNYQAAGRRDVFTRYQGDDGRRAVELDRAGGLRVALQRHQPADLGPDELRRPRSSCPRHPGACHEARAVPRVRRRSVSGGPRRNAPWVLDAYTATDKYPYSQTTSGEGGLASWLQLRAQLGEGHGRRVQRHGHVLRVRPAATRSSSRGARRSRTCSPTPRRCPTSCGTHLRYPEDLFQRPGQRPRDVPRDRSRRRFYDANASG